MAGYLCKLLIPGRLLKNVRQCKLPFPNPFHKGESEMFPIGLQLLVPLHWYFRTIGIYFAGCHNPFRG